MAFSKVPKRVGTPRTIRSRGPFLAGPLNFAPAPEGPGRSGPPAPRRKCHRSSGNDGPAPGLPTARGSRPEIGILPCWFTGFPWSRLRAVSGMEGKIWVSLGRVGPGTGSDVANRGRRQASFGAPRGARQRGIYQSGNHLKIVNADPKLMHGKSGENRAGRGSHH